jgi:hypothetical protein
MANASTSSKAATAYAIAIARRHQGEGEMSSSATLCADDAAACWERGDVEGAYRRAKDSLTHSVGMFAAAYKEVAAMERA